MITCVFGLPGQGKSTYMAYLARKALTSRRGKKAYQRVYCNFEMAGCHKIDYSDLGRFHFEHCLILLDEMMNEADSRDFKSFDAEKKYFFSNHRHYHVDIIYFTQAWDDVDKKIRNNTQELYWIKKLWQFSVVMPIKRVLAVDDMTHQIITGYEMAGLIKGCFIWRPPYYKWFNSYEQRQLIPVVEKRHPLYAPMPEVTTLGDRIKKLAQAVARELQKRREGKYIESAEEGQPYPELEYDCISRECPEELEGSA